MREQDPDNIDETAGNGALADLLKGLDRVDPPNDFDRRVRKRIAGGKAEARERRGWPLVPVYVYGLALAIIVGSAFLLTEFYRSNIGPVPEVTKTEPEPVRKLDDSDGTRPIAPSVQPEANRKEAAAGDTGNKVPIVHPGNAPSATDGRNSGRSGQRPGGSIDLGRRNAEQILPRGFDVDVNSGKKNAPAMPNTGGLSIGDLTGSLGMEGKFEGQALRITSVRSGSVADRSGVKRGDILAAVDETPITPSTKFGSRIDAKTLTMIREGQRVLIRIGGQ